MKITDTRAVPLNEPINKLQHGDCFYYQDDLFLLTDQHNLAEDRVGAVRVYDGKLMQFRRNIFVTTQFTAEVKITRL